ncbi:Sorbose reductase sou1 [Fusarium oxysporum f. sp. albedinis]|nr:Sorbose reductase sou1 [Fusarium oxysporum f. sp. albedinis]
MVLCCCVRKQIRAQRKLIDLMVKASWTILDSEERNIKNKAYQAYVTCYYFGSKSFNILCFVTKTVMTSESVFFYVACENYKIYLQSSRD